jgi:hypothetical protein
VELINFYGVLNSKSCLDFAVLNTHAHKLLWHSRPDKYMLTLSGVMVSLSRGAAALVDQDLLIIEASRSHSDTTMVRTPLDE